MSWFPDSQRDPARNGYTPYLDANAQGNHLRQPPLAGSFGAPSLYTPYAPGAPSRYIPYAPSYPGLMGAAEYRSSFPYPPGDETYWSYQPQATENQNQGPGDGSRKRRHEDAHHTQSHKWAKEESKIPEGGSKLVLPLQFASLHQPPQGTLHNPYQIDSSPEPELFAQRPMGVMGMTPCIKPEGATDTLSESEVFIQSESGSKFYAVASGFVPGIYTVWTDVEKQITGFSGAKQKKFKTKDTAWAFLEENKDLVRAAIQRRSFLSERPVRAPSHWDLNDFPQHGHSPGMTHISPQRNYVPFPETYRSGFDILPRPATEDFPPPYTFYDQSARPLDSAHLAPPPKKKVFVEEPEPILSPEQQNVVDLIMQGHNVFYTGSAGCGKSTILKAFVKRLKEQEKRVKIVAPTNLAALNVNGQTTWSFAGWTPDSMKRPLDKLKQAAHGKEVLERFEDTDVLVIDEISMVENHVFERLNEIMKAARGERFGSGPFGGVQLVVTGDFYQLSPVKPFQYCIGCGWELIVDNKWRPKVYTCENSKCNQLEFFDIDKWAFRSKAWEQCNFQHVNLTEIHRQSDRKFISILQKIRTEGIILKPHAHLLLNHASETKDAIKLFARRDDVDCLNKEKIAQLPSEPIKYRCMDHFDWKYHHRDEESLGKYTRQWDDGTLFALKEHRYDVFVQLKEGMRIVLQANLEPSAGLVNGSQGTIIGFEPYDEKNLPRAPRGPGDNCGPGIQILKGAHGEYFEHQIKYFAKQNGCQAWPIVDFDRGPKRTIYADCTANELGKEEPYSLLSRTQIPLMAGYAITVHKSQGMTLDRVIVNLARAFEPSQIYVALSRARSLQGLKVEGLPSSNLGGTNEQVKEFFEKYLTKKNPEPARVVEAASAPAVEDKSEKDGI